MKQLACRACTLKEYKINLMVVSSVFIAPEKKEEDNEKTKVFAKAFLTYPFSFSVALMSVLFPKMHRAIIFSPPSFKLFFNDCRICLLFFHAELFVVGL